MAKKKFSDYGIDMKKLVEAMGYVHAAKFDSLYAKAKKMKGAKEAFHFDDQFDDENLDEGDDIGDTLEKLSNLALSKEGCYVVQGTVWRFYPECDEDMLVEAIEVMIDDLKELA